MVKRREPEEWLGWLDEFSSTAEFQSLKEVKLLNSMMRKIICAVEDEDHELLNEGLNEEYVLFESLKLKREEFLEPTIKEQAVYWKRRHTWAHSILKLPEESPPRIAQLLQAALVHFDCWFRDLECQPPLGVCRYSKCGKIYLKDGRRDRRYCTATHRARAAEEHG